MELLRTGFLVLTWSLYIFPRLLRPTPHRQASLSKKKKKNKQIFFGQGNMPLQSEAPWKWSLTKRNASNANRAPIHCFRSL